MHRLERWHVGMRNGFNADTIFAYNGSDLFEDGAVCKVYGIWAHTKIDKVQDCDGFPNARLIEAAPFNHVLLHCILHRGCPVYYSKKDRRFTLDIGTEVLLLPEVGGLPSCPDDATFDKLVRVAGLA